MPLLAPIDEGRIFARFVADAAPKHSGMETLRVEAWTGENLESVVEHFFLREELRYAANVWWTGGRIHIRVDLTTV